MNKYLELLIGVILLVVGIWGIYFFSVYAGHGAVQLVDGQPVISPVLVLIEGAWGFFVTFLGLIFLMLGISDLS